VLFKNTYQRLDAKKALIGTTQVAYLKYAMKVNFMERKGQMLNIKQIKNTK
jgi:hypothetical protein